MKRSLGIVVIACFPSLLGCDRDDPVIVAPRIEPRPIRVEWFETVTAGGKALIEGGGEIEVHPEKGEYAVTLRSLPWAGSWAIGDRKGKIEGPTRIGLPLAERIGGYTLAELAKFDPKATLDLELPDGRAGSVPLPAIDVTHAVGEMLIAAERGPVRFGSEPADPHERDSIYWRERRGDTPFLGKTGKLHEIDRVLFVRRLPEAKGEKVCKGYRDDKGNPAPDVTLVLHETEAVLHDRRTGEALEGKTFPPDENCMWLVTETVSHRHAKDETIEAWALGHLAN